MFGGQKAKSVKVYADKSNPIAGTMIPGLLQKAAMSSMRADMIRSGMAQFETFGGGLTSRQKVAMDQFDKLLTAQQEAGNDGKTQSPEAGMMLPVELVHPQDEKTKEPRSLVAFYMAGIGGMFLDAGATATKAKTSPNCNNNQIQQMRIQANTNNPNSSPSCSFTQLGELFLLKMKKKK